MSPPINPTVTSLNAGRRREMQGVSGIPRRGILIPHFTPPVWENVLQSVSFNSLPGKTDRRCLDWAPGSTAKCFF